MKNFRVTVNGNTYDVQVEELAAGQAAAPIPAATPAAAPKAAAAPAPKPAPAGGGTPVNAPMPGNVFDIKVNVGDKVEANQVVVVLEAMKMENEIVTPKAGTVASVNVNKGDAVNSGDVLVTIA